jgi:hypothetical protein
MTLGIDERGLRDTVPVALAIACYWSENPPIRNVPARFYDMAAETSGDANAMSGSTWTCLLLVKKIHQ